MKTAADISDLNLTTPAYRVANTSREEFPHFLAQSEQDTMKHFDADNWIRQLQAMMSLDVSKPFGGSMEKAAAAVRAGRKPPRRARCAWRYFISGASAAGLYRRSEERSSAESVSAKRSRKALSTSSTGLFR